MLAFSLICFPRYLAALWGRALLGSHPPVLAADGLCASGSNSLAGGGSHNTQVTLSWTAVGCLPISVTSFARTIGTSNLKAIWLWVRLIPFLRSKVDPNWLDTVPSSYCLGCCIWFSDEHFILSQGTERRYLLGNFWERKFFFFFILPKGVAIHCSPEDQPLGEADMVKVREERNKNWDLDDVIELLDQATPEAYILLDFQLLCWMIWYC